MDDDRDRPDGRNTPAERRRFRLALGVFVLWVAALGIMAVVSGRRPAQNPAAVEER